MEITGKTALVTGASRGIGKSIALAFARQGAKQVLVLARNQAALEELAQEIREMGIKSTPIPCDITNIEQVNIAVAQAWRDHGPIDILVNCAGIAHQQMFLQSHPRQLQEEIGVNLVGLLTITRAVARRMVKQRQGLIVNVSSLMGKLAAPTMATYSATKFAILGLTQALRGELQPYNVRVVALLPSLTDTDMVRGQKHFRWVQTHTPSEVALALVRGIEADRAEILVGWQAQVADLLQRFLPPIAELLVRVAAPKINADPLYLPN